jgi:hypothetical protein
MNGLDYYYRRMEPWEEKEDKSIRHRYEVKEMNISEIADIHRRTPGSISYKLRSLGIIEHNTLARGYLEYKKSNLYKEIVNTNKTTDNPRRVRENHRKKIKEDKKTTIACTNDKEIPSDIIQIKNDIKEIKESISKLVKMLEDKCYIL